MVGSEHSSLWEDHAQRHEVVQEPCTLRAGNELEQEPRGIWASPGTGLRLGA